MEACGSKDLRVTPWVEDAESGQFSRTITGNHPAEFKFPGIPAMVPFTRTQLAMHPPTLDAPTGDGSAPRGPVLVETVVVSKVPDRCHCWLNMICSTAAH
jgi:hypothetical protein